jgi:hypothetical protein
VNLILAAAGASSVKRFSRASSDSESHMHKNWSNYLKFPQPISLTPNIYTALLQVVAFRLAAVDELKKTNLEYLLRGPNAGLLPIKHFKYLKDIGKIKGQ